MNEPGITETGKPAGGLVVREPSRLDDLARLGSWLALSETGSDSEKAKGAAAALRLYYAAELGLPPLAVAELSVIKGRLFVSAQLLRALAERAGYQIRRADDSDDACTAVLTRGREELGRATFTLAQAKQAGLIRNGSAWQSHPARMLWARASKNVIVDFAPAVALGLALDDEIVEYRGDPVDNGVYVETTYISPSDTEQEVQTELERHAKETNFQAPASVQVQEQIDD